MKSSTQGISYSVNDTNFVVKPSTKKAILPEETTNESIRYTDIWRGVDLEYKPEGELLKENIILKNKQVDSSYTFEVSGAELKPGPQEQTIGVKGLPDDFCFGELSLIRSDIGPIADKKAEHHVENNKIVVTIDKDWLQTLPDSAFPLTIDPSFGRWDNDFYDWMFKSDGYSCKGDRCWTQVGTIDDRGWKHWRSYAHFPYPELAGKRVLSANIHGYFHPNAGSDPHPRYVSLGHANCIGWNCLGKHLKTVLVASDFDINVTDELQRAVSTGNYGATWSLWGEEVPYKTFKTYSDLLLSVNYDTPTPQPKAVYPINDQIVIDTQPTLKVNPVSDPDGAVQYKFTVATNRDGSTGMVINSNWSESPTWTVPDGVLQDGTTYYWRVYARDKNIQYPTTGSVQSFRVNLRTGKDSTQSYDTVGPVGIDLATGNATLSSETHSMQALGGSMGLSLNYNTPNKAKKGLKAEYWSVPSTYNHRNGAPSTTPNTIRRDQKIDFNWATGRPSDSVSADHFYARWTGQFVAPETGEYYFGGKNDDFMQVWIGDELVYDKVCLESICYNKPVSLTAGQAVPLRVQFREYVGNAYAKLYVKGAVSERIVPQGWLYTNVENQAASHGLTGRYYDDTGDRDINKAIADPTRLLMVRQDTKMNLNFGSGGSSTRLANR